MNQWRTEYLTSLRESSKSTVYPSTNGKGPINVGEVVILKSDKSARAFWNLAKVEELITSKDGVVRAARVRVINQGSGKSTMLRRPVQHLIPLEIRSDGEQTDAKAQSTQPVESQREGSSSEETNNSRKKVFVQFFIF